MTDMVIAAVRDYDWSAIRTYANSLVRSQFAGRKVMFVDNLAPGTRRILEHLGFEVNEMATESGPRFVTHSRFEPVYKFLQSSDCRDVRYVIWTDVRDVVFQDNPTPWLEQNLAPGTLVATGEGWLISNEPFNDTWARLTLDNEAEHAWLREHEVLCGGVLAGQIKELAEVLQKIHEMVKDKPQANDQAALNYILRKHYADAFRAPRPDEGFCATWFPEKILDPARLIPDYGTPVFRTVDKKVYVPNTSRPFYIVHQYDRCPVWKELIDREYQWPAG